MRGRLRGKASRDVLPEGVSDSSVDRARRVRVAAAKVPEIADLPEAIKAGHLDVTSAAKIAKVATSESPELAAAALHKVTSGEARNVTHALHHLRRENVKAATAPSELSLVVIGDAAATLREPRSQIAEHLARVDVVIADPPYGLDTHRTRTGGHDYADGPEYALDVIERTAAALAEVLPESAHLYWFAGYSHAWHVAEVLRKHFDVRENPLVWNKARPTIAGDYKWQSAYELIWFATTRSNRHRLVAHKERGDVLTFAIERESNHSAEKPVDLIRTLIEASSHGGIVLDPFAGSGTTGIAAAKLGRGFIGIEVDPTIAESATRRLGLSE
jgi:DNA modification methylase